MTDSRNKLQRTVLTICCGTHGIQDGLVALQYVLLPILAQLFSLSYAQVGLLRAVSNIAMSALEIPSGVLAERWGERRLIVMGLIAAGVGYIGVAFSSAFLVIAFCFLITGAGAGFQHSLTSAVIARRFHGSDRRRALGTYNSAGDAGKLAFTGLFSVGIGAGLAWNGLVIGLALVSVLFGGITWKLMRGTDINPTTTHQSLSGSWGIKTPGRFMVLGLIVFLDSVVQAVFLTFLAFILLEKGGGESLASIAVVLALTGGMIGKFCCGYLAVRLGDRNTFILIQLLTVLGLMLLVYLPSTTLLLLLPAIGLVVQSSSTVTYGSIPDFVEQDKQSRGYALIYTLANVSSVCGPLLFGIVADSAGLDLTVWILALVALLTLPFSFILSTAHAKSVAV